MARQGMAQFVSRKVSELLLAGHGVARHGSAGLGSAGRGKVAIAPPEGDVVAFAARHAAACHAMARRGREWLGKEPLDLLNSGPSELEKVMADATRFPIDFDALEKGSLIDGKTIERFRQITCPNVAFRWAMLDLRDQIKRRLADRGLHVVIVSEDDALRILRDAEATTYSSEMQHRRLRQAMRHYADQAAVDVRNLTSEEHTLHERSLEVNGKYVQALAQAGSRYSRMDAHRRATPGLPGSGTQSEV